MMDNVACMFYINWQGRARSLSLCARAIKLWNWCIVHRIPFSAMYIGMQNTTVNVLNRRFSQDCEWDLVVHRDNLTGSEEV